jgi:hypothetical protein
VALTLIEVELTKELAETHELLRRASEQSNDSFIKGGHRPQLSF